MTRERAHDCCWRPAVYRGMKDPWEEVDAADLDFICEIDIAGWNNTVLWSMP
jgi:hypothetical protein